MLSYTFGTYITIIHLNKITMIKKRAQVSLFIIVGILILGLIVFISFFKLNDSEKKQTAEEKIITSVPFDTSSVSFLLESCLEKTAKEALIFTGARGGDLFLVHPFSIEYKSGTHTTTYAYVDGQITLLPFSIIISNIEKYMEQQLPVCTNWEKIPQVIVTPQGNPSIHVQIDSVTLDAKMIWQINVQKNDGVSNVKTTISSFETAVKTSAQKKYDALYRSAQQYALLGRVIDEVFTADLGMHIEFTRVDNAWLVVIKDGNESFIDKKNVDKKSSDNTLSNEKSFNEVWISAFDTKPFEKVRT